MKNFGDFNRVNTNVSSLGARLSLNKINSELGDSRLKLSTGKRINSAEDDSAGYAIATKLYSRVKGLEQALQNVSDAKSMLDIVEEAYNSVLDILINIKSLSLQAANESLDTNDRSIINNEIEKLTDEINYINVNTKSLSGENILDGGNFTFQVGENSDDVFIYNSSKITVNSLFPSQGLENGSTGDQFGDENLGYNSYSSTYPADAQPRSPNNLQLFHVNNGIIPFEDEDGNLDSDMMMVATRKSDNTIVQTSYSKDWAVEEHAIVMHTESPNHAGYIGGITGNRGNISIQDDIVNHEDYNVFLGHVDYALNQMNSKVNELGINQRSLSSKEENLNQAITANSAAHSRIMDTDFAKEQSNSIRLQILQQTATAALSQANMGSQAVLGLLD